LQTKDADNKKLWYLDSGCSKHMTRDASELIGLVIKHGGFVTYGDKNKGKIISYGYIYNTLENNPRIKKKQPKI